MHGACFCCGQPGDLFPGLELPVVDYGALMVAIEAEIAKQGLQVIDFTKFKTLQLFESKALRHCNMLVGRTMAGKSVAWKTLQAAKTTLAKSEEESGYQPVHVSVLNSKSVTMSELYGAYDLATMEWADGVLSTIFRHCAQDEVRAGRKLALQTFEALDSTRFLEFAAEFRSYGEAMSSGQIISKEGRRTRPNDAHSSLWTTRFVVALSQRPDEKWIVLDGPVDTLWIEVCADAGYAPHSKRAAALAS